MGSLVYTALMTCLWVVNLFTGTGLGTTYHVTAYAQVITYVLTALVLGGQMFSMNGLWAKKSDFIIYSCLFAVLLTTALLNGHGKETWNYLWVFCLVYLISHLSIDEKTFLWTGLIYGVAGAGILYVYDYGTVLSGWNGNSIAMIGMHSFLMFVIPFFNRSSIKSKIVLILGTVLFAYLIYPTESRSSILYMAIGAAFSINLIPRNLILKGRKRIVFFLLTPLLVAIVVILVAKTNLFISLDAWSYEQFSKPIFNGRDDIWRDGFTILFQHPLFGLGDLGYTAWHNSAVTCLVSYGIVGYLIWIAAFRQIIEETRTWFGDYIIQGCVVSFFVLYMQQSVELGFISVTPSLIAYVMLGMLLGRKKYLQKKEGTICRELN